MNSNMAVDGDPLSTYGYPLYGVYEPPVNPNPYPYDVKVENTPSNPYNTQVTKEQEIQQSYKLENNDGVKSYTPTYTPNDSVEKIINSVINESEQCPNSNEDIKPDIKDLKPKRGRKNKTGRRSSYFAEKIKEVGFPFYGCAVCDISFPALHELDQHVTTHKGRVTSYHLRVKNRLKRKMLKKQQKKLQKAKSVKKEFEIEIKPEDGYIGSQTTESYRSNCNENGTDVPNKNSKNAKEIEKLGNASDDGVNQNLEKIYKCFACKKQFQLSYYLKLHVRSHTDEKPYQCPECGESFITASKLGRHNKRVHLSIKYQCRICFKMFARFENLTRHFDKTHPEDKLEGEPYDYNAILPYLKEMEQELREKAEAEETRKQMKSEGFWPEDWLCATETKDEMKEEKTEDKDRPPESQVAVVEVKIPEIEPEIVVKVENEDSQEDHGPDLNDEPVSCDRIKEEGLKNEEESDDDYFPDNTWTEQPKMDAEPSSPQTKKRTPKNTGSKQCEICQKEVSSSSYMKVHMRTHTGERPFKCYICKRGFITASKMHRHAMTHEESWLEEDNKPVKTEITDVKVEIEITREDEDKKKSETIISYQKAKDRFYKKIKRNQDKKPVDRSRPKKRPHPCEFCQKRFLHLETLNIHKKSHEGEDAVRQCYYCLLKMDNDEALKTHEATHTGPKPYFCTLCGKSYKKRETMVYHRKNHKQEKKFICDICSKPFNAPCKLQRHIVSHRASKFILRYECPVCAHMFNTKYHIRMHLTTHQKEGLIMEENRNEVLAMVLQNARRIPRSPDAPANLSDLIPADERSRVCNICGAVFQHFYYLEEHLKSHGSKIAIEDDPAKEEKKYICPVCHKGFKLHYYLKLHSFTHTKEKPFICQQCGKGFITKGKLKRHLETHAGLKKYQCHICYKFFTRPSYLRIHVRTIHGTQDSYRSVLLDRQ